MKKISSVSNGIEADLGFTISKSRTKTLAHHQSLPTNIFVPNTNRKNPAQSDLAMIRNYFKLISNCNDLQRDINEVSSNIEHNIEESKNDVKIEKYLKKNIRNLEYKKGVERIKVKLEQKRNSNLPKELKKLRSVINKDHPVASIEPKDLSSKDAKKYLFKKKRNFGQHFCDSPPVQKGTGRKKNIEIKIDPEETIRDGFQGPYLSSLNRQKSVSSLHPIQESPFSLPKVANFSQKKLSSVSISKLLISRSSKKSL